MPSESRGTAWLVASVAGVGVLRSAPGSWASLVAAVAGAGLVGHPLWLAGGVVAACLAGLWAIPRAGGDHDPGWVVIDEVAGQWLTLLGLAGLGGPWHDPGGWRLAAGVAAAFLLFRVFDVTKPGPVGWADRQEGAGWVMADDLIAGTLAAAVLLAGRATVVWAARGG